MRTYVQRRSQPVIGFVALALMILLVSGCTQSSRPLRFDLALRASPTLEGKTATVHLVGVNNSDKSAWESYEISEYWQRGDKLRKSAEDRGLVYRMDVGGSEPVKTLSSADEIWTRWGEKDAMWIFVIADLPGRFEDRPGAKDMRRKIIPLENKWWERKAPSTIDISLQEGGVFVETSHLSERRK